MQHQLRSLDSPTKFALDLGCEIMATPTPPAGSERMEGDAHFPEEEGQSPTMTSTEPNVTGTLQPPSTENQDFTTTLDTE